MNRGGQAKEQRMILNVKLPKFNFKMEISESDNFEELIDLACEKNNLSKELQEALIIFISRKLNKSLDKPTQK